MVPCTLSATVNLGRDGGRGRKTGSMGLRSRDAVRRACSLPGYLPGSGLYVKLLPRRSATAERRKRRSIVGSAAAAKGADSSRRRGATSCRRMHRQSRSGSALEGASTCWERARVRRRDGSWRWHNLKRSQTPKRASRRERRRQRPTPSGLAGKNTIEVGGPGLGFAN